MKGSCLCGAVAIEVEGGLDREPEACHCRQCRKQTGHFFVAVNVRRAALSVDGQDHVRWYRSSAEVERGFCSRCGSTLFWKPSLDGYEYTAVAMGLFDGPTGTRISKHTFAGDKGDYYELDDGAETSEGY